MYIVWSDYHLLDLRAVIGLGRTYSRQAATDEPHIFAIPIKLKRLSGKIDCTL